MEGIEFLIVLAVFTWAGFYIGYRYWKWKKRKVKIAWSTTIEKFESDKATEIINKMKAEFEIKEAHRNWHYVDICPKCNGEKCDFCNYTGHVEITNTFIKKDSLLERLYKLEFYHSDIEFGNPIVYENCKYIKYEDVKKLIESFKE